MSSSHQLVTYSKFIRYDPDGNKTTPVYYQAAITGLIRQKGTVIQVAANAQSVVLWDKTVASEPFQPTTTYNTSGGGFDYFYIVADNELDVAFIGNKGQSTGHGFVLRVRPQRPICIPSGLTTCNIVDGATTNPFTVAEGGAGSYTGITYIAVSEPLGNVVNVSYLIESST